MAIGPSPRYLEELSIGGGYGDSTDGGADFKKTGDISTNGNMVADGDVTAGGDISAVNVNASADVAYASSSTSRITLNANLVEDPIPLGTTGWIGGGTVAMSNEVPDWAPLNAQSLSLTDPGDDGDSWGNLLYRTIPAGSLIDGSKYTLSFWCKGNVSGLKLNMAGFGMANTPFTVFIRSDISITTSWAFYMTTWTYTASGYTGTFRVPHLEFGSNTIAGTFYFHNIKLERGEVATPFLALGALDAHSDGKIGPHADPDLIALESGKVTIDGDLDLDGGDLVVGTDGGTRGIVTAWDGSGGSAPGCVKLASPNGTVRYLFVEDDGTLKVHSSLPTQNTDGTVVGSQT